MAAVMAAEAAGAGMPPLVAVLDVLDRDGAPRQSHAGRHWPLRIGRALDNDLVLADPYVAPHHAAIECEDDAEALSLVVGSTRNGLQLGGTALQAGERQALAADGEPLELQLGHTRLRLRLPGHAVAPELPLPVAAPPAPSRRPWPTLAAAAVSLALLVGQTWLDAEPENSTRALAAALTSAVLVLAVWCGAWALLSKTFAGRSRFGWHLRVALTGMAAWGVLGVGSELLAFSLSWPWVSDFAFVPGYAIAAATLWGHLLAVEPSRPRLMRGVAVAAFVCGTALSMWFQQQRQQRLGTELYMSHLFPPALRLARPVPVDRFVDGLATLQPVLEQRVKDSPNGPGAGDDDGP